MELLNNVANTRSNKSNKHHPGIQGQLLPNLGQGGDLTFLERYCLLVRAKRYMKYGVDIAYQSFWAVNVLVST